MHDQVIDTSHGETLRHEPTDIHTRPLRIAAIIGGVGLIVICLALWGLFSYFAKSATQPDRELVTREVQQSSTPKAPEPRIQGVPEFHGNVPRADMEQLRRESEERLHSYGKGDEKGFVRIPI